MRDESENNRGHDLRFHRISRDEDSVVVGGVRHIHRDHSGETNTQHPPSWIVPKTVKW